LKYPIRMRKENPLLEIDEDTAAALEELAKAWGMSRQEAARRAIAEAKASTVSVDGVQRIKAFRELQRRLHLTPEEAASWQDLVREGRR
jgi:hypothetical protein